MDPRTALACCALALAGCSLPPTPSDAPTAARTPPTVQTVRGTATYAERIKMPPGASLRVELLDAASGRPVASSLSRDVAGPPITFSIARAPGAAPAGAYALRAVLLGPKGERWFETPRPVALTVPDGIELRLRRATGETTVTPPPTVPVAHWECGELGLMSRYDKGAGTVTLAFNGTRRVLPMARSASGARYADAQGNEFWTKGATGHLVLAGEPARDCVEAAQPSPWNVAAERGAVFRAVGGEPGWSIEIAGTPPVLDARLDYGEHRLSAPVSPVHDGFETVHEGKPVRVRAERRVCHDGMSGQAFEATVTLDALGRTYCGCGAWLQD